jgi:hypothetical protein
LMTSWCSPCRMWAPPLLVGVTQFPSCHYFIGHERLRHIDIKQPLCYVTSIIDSWLEIS